MRKFWKTYSRREILSAVFSSSLIVGLFTFIANLGLESREFILFAIFLVTAAPLIASHRIYLIEHGRRNRFLGRLLQDLVTAIFTATLGAGVFLIGGTMYKVGSVPDLFMICLIFILFTELLITLINRIFLLIGWQIW